MTLEARLGRSLAFCAHPQAAWHRLPAGGRALLVTAYVLAGYVTVLGTLLAL